MRRLLLLLMLGFGVMVYAPSLPTYAYGPFSTIDCDGRDAANSAVCKDKTTENPLVGEGGILLSIANIIAYIAGAVAVIMIIVAGIKFITANGDANAISSARSTIITALVGLAIIILAGTMIRFVILRL